MMADLEPTPDPQDPTPTSDKDSTPGPGNGPTPDQNPDKIEPAEQIDEEAALPNRRQFFRRFFKGAAMGVESAFILSPFYADQYVDDSALQRRIVDFRNGRGPYPYQDVELTLSNGTTVRNLGVAHVEEEFRFSGDHIEQAIRDTDVVFLEGPIVSYDAPGYFRSRAEYALDQGKIVYDIDAYKFIQLSIDIQSGAKNLFAFTGGLALGVEAAGTMADVIKDGGLLRRTFFRGIGYYGALTMLPSSSYAVSQVVHPDGYPAPDVSFVVDARTILMLDHMTHIAEKHPGKKLLVISGDMHARGYNYYRSSAAAHTLYESKKAIYEGIYGDYNHRAEQVKELREPVHSTTIKMFRF